MRLNHIKIAYRNLRRDFTYSSINIAGLVIGITVSVFIFLWVSHEHSFDSFHSDTDRIYRINNEVEYGGGYIETGMTSPYPLLYELKNIPEVEHAASIVISGDEIKGVKVNEVVFPVARKAVYLDPEWFDIFDYTLLEGSFAAFKSYPFSVVLTRLEAQRYFGNNASAIGQRVAINGVEHVVQAVVANNPTNSSFQWDVFASIESYLANPLNRETSEKWVAFDNVIFIKLRQDADANTVIKKINNLYIKNGEKATASLQPLSEIYFDTNVSNWYMTTGNHKIVSLFSLLGVLLLMTACINYINLTTAKSNMRTKEVGVRKIFGADSPELFMQFIVESFTVCCIAIILSILTIWLLSPFYHLLSGRSAALSFTSPVIWIILFIILFVTTMLNGIYPALLLSSFQPMNFLKGIGVLKIKSSNLRRGLVIFQFALSTILIVYTMIIYAQMNYIQQKDRGYNYENVISIKTPSSADNTMKLKVMMSELKADPAIMSATLSSQEITGIAGITRGADWDGREKSFEPYITLMGADDNYQMTLGLQLAEGRWFESEKFSDDENVILNETAIREFGIHKPYIGQRFEIAGKSGQIIGVVKDFHYRNLHQRIEPLVILNQWHNMITIKNYPGQSSQALHSLKTMWVHHFPNDPFEYSFLNDSFNKQYKSEINTSRIIFIFSILSIIIALLGLFGLSTFTIERRFKEIGIRKILGGSVSNMICMLSKEFLIQVCIAMLIAFPLAYFWADKMLQDYAYHINISWRIFAVAGIITLTLTILTIGWQVTRAAMSNPAKVIKSE